MREGEVKIPCNLCGGIQRRFLYHVPDYRFHPEEKFPIVQCLTCGLVFVDPRPSLEEMERYYPLDYYQGFVDQRCVSLRPNRLKLVQQLKPKGKILDIGCHRGELLAQMKEQGWEVWGSELSGEGCTYARKTLGLERIFEGDFLSHHLPANSFDVVTMWHTVEHLFDPRKVLLEIRRLLKEDGVLLVECPDFDSLIQRLFGAKLYPWDVPRHLFHFNAKTLAELMNRTGFYVVEKRKSTNLLFDHGVLREALIWGVGLNHLRTRGREGTQGPPSSAKFLWRMARACFNGFCLVGTLFIVSLGQGSILYFVCQKQGAFSEREC